MVEFKSNNLNKKLLKCLERSFLKYLEEGARRLEKLKILHPNITEDLRNLLGNNYQLHSLR
ncbi:MAG: hypothetical protein NY202_03800 [Mollicutes bacterium UO1]